MELNALQIEYIGDLAGDERHLVTICSDIDDEAVMRVIASRFPRHMPYEAPSIFWPSLKTQTDAPSPESVERRSKAFLNQLVADGQLCSGERLVILWDEEGYATVKVSLDMLLRRLGDFVRLPPHMFVVPEDFRWCVVFRMEGDIGLTYPIA